MTSVSVNSAPTDLAEQFKFSVCFLDIGSSYKLIGGVSAGSDSSSDHYAGKREIVDDYDGDSCDLAGDVVL